VRQPAEVVLRLGYDSHVLTVNIAELKNRLSAFLQKVRAGEELLIKDRNVPVAKIIPFRRQDSEFDEFELVASGQMNLPRKALDEKRFWSIGGSLRRTERLQKALDKAIEQERDDAGVLGRQFHTSNRRTGQRK
jgi:prevent-host-death family protein